VASVTFETIHDNVTTKADAQAGEARERGGHRCQPLPW
jgi:hypothetical protein